jgi:hypothetical protein
LPGASSKIKALRGLKSSMNIQYIGKRSETSARGVRRRRSAGVEHIGGQRAAAMIWRPTSMHRLEANRRKGKHLRNSIKHDIS